MTFIGLHALSVETATAVSTVDSSLRMARAEFERQLATPAYERRWPAIKQGIQEVERRMDALKDRLG